MEDKIIILGLQIEIWALFLSSIAIIITLLKDFIIPFFFKPKIEFKYEERSPFRREHIAINGTSIFGTFLRFSVHNIGRRPAINCRCQILEVKKDHIKYGDYQGFPLKWASRPESIISQVSGERLNIAIGETEFIDLAATTNQNNLIYLQKYHNVDIGIRGIIEYGKYEIIVIFSGDNFNPYKLLFEIDRNNSNNPNDVKLKFIGNVKNTLN